MSRKCDLIRTVFVSNIPTTADFACPSEKEGSVYKVFRKHGNIESITPLLDQRTQVPRGTCFIMFSNKSAARKSFYRAGGDDQKADTGLVTDLVNDTSEDRIEISGQRVFVRLAISRDEATKKSDIKAQENSAHDVRFVKPTGKDRRNMHLMKVGLILADTPEAEGVSDYDVSKRLNSYRERKKRLAANPNFAVSSTRLCVRNVPKNMTDGKFRTILEKALEKTGSTADAVTESRVIRDDHREDGAGRGFGFWSVATHTQAMSVLQALNNAENVFTPSRRPIIEFSVENALKLHAREDQKMRQKEQPEKKEKKKPKRLYGVVNKDRKRGKM